MEWKKRNDRRNALLLVKKERPSPSVSGLATAAIVTCRSVCESKRRFGESPGFLQGILFLRPFEEEKGCRLPHEHPSAYEDPLRKDGEGQILLDVLAAQLRDQQEDECDEDGAERDPVEAAERSFPLAEQCSIIIPVAGGEILLLCRIRRGSLDEKPDLDPLRERDVGRADREEIRQFRVYVALEESRVVPFMVEIAVSFETDIDDPVSGRLVLRVKCAVIAQAVASSRFSNRHTLFLPFCFAE